MQNPRPRPIWLGHCLLSRLELDHGAFQLPGALQMRESSKHDNQRKLGRWSPREGRTGASTEHVQTLWSRRAPRQASQALLPACLSHLDGGCLLCSSPTGQGTGLALHFTSSKAVVSAAEQALEYSFSQLLLWLSLAAQSVYALRQTRKSVSRGLFHEAGLGASHKDEKIRRTDSSGKLPKVLAQTHVPSTPIICMLQRWPHCYVITPAP